MSRLFIYDENMVDERAKITVAKMAAVSDIVAPEKQFIQYTNKGEVTVLAGCVIAVGENAVFKTEEKTLTKANLDQGADFAHGNDYYIYICDPGTDNQDEVYLISLNSTFPDRVRIHQFAHHTQYGTADPHVKPGKRYTSED